MRPVAAKVPAATAIFWLAKVVTTALGESTSDFLVRTIDPVVAVAIGFVAFVIALAVQLTRRRYEPWAYWLTVAMVGVFGTMAADVLHVGFGVPYLVSTPLFALALAAVFVLWRRVEGTVSIHSITSTRREIFYWLAVVTTFALGTAAGDLTAVTFRLGYFEAGAMFAFLIAGVFTGHRWLELDPVVGFWAAYVVTRPLGASGADWLGQPPARGGVGLGSGPVSLALAIVLVAIVVGLEVVRRRSAGRPQARPHDTREHESPVATADAEQST